MPGLEGSSVTVKSMGADMVVVDVSKFFHSVIQSVIRMEIKEVGAFVFQSVEVSLHRGIIIRTASFAHALCHMDRLTEINKGLGGKLGSLITVQDEFSLQRGVSIQSFLQGTYGQIAGDMAVGDGGDHAAVIQVDNGAVVSYLAVFQEQVSEIRTPLVVDTMGMEILIELVFKHFVGLSVFVARLLRSHDGTQSQLRIHILMYRCRTIGISLPLQVDSHPSVSVHSVVAMVDFFNFRHNLCLLGIIIRLPMFPVVVISVWTDP